MKININLFKKKLAQEEMVGFALIMIIVMIIVLIILGFALTRSKGVEEKDFQLTGFIEASLQVTTDCKFNDEFLTIRGMVHQCNQRQKCDGSYRDICSELSKNFKEIITQSFNPSNESYVRGYTLQFRKVGEIEEDITPPISGGQQTKTVRGGYGEFIRGTNNYRIYLTNYY